MSDIIDPAGRPRRVARWGEVRPASSRLAVAVCGLAVFVDVLGSGIVVPAIPEFAALFGASEAHMGYAFAAFAAAFLLSVLPLGAVYDRFARSDLMIGAGMLVIAAAALIFASATSIWLLALAQGMHGIGSAATWIAAQPLAARIAQRYERRSVWFSAITISMGLGLVAGPLLGTVGSLKTPFLVYLALALFAALVVFVVLRGQGGHSEPDDPQHKTAPGLARYMSVLANPSILGACLVMTVLYTAVGVLEVVFPLLMDSHGYEKAGIGVLFFWFAVFMVVSQPLAGRWMDRVGPVAPTVVSLVGIALLLPVAALGQSFAVWIPVFAVVGVLGGIPISATMLLIATRCGPGQRGVAYALWNFAFSIGYLVGPAGGGFLAEVSAGWGRIGGLEFPFFVLMVVMVAFVPVFVHLDRRTSRPGEGFCHD